MQILCTNFFLCGVLFASVHNKESMECKVSKLGKYLISKPFDKIFQNCNHLSALAIALWITRFYAN